MKRRVFNILSALSLALAVGVAGLWVASYWRMICLGCVGRQDARLMLRSYALVAVGGRLHMGRLNLIGTSPERSGPPGWTLDVNPFDHAAYAWTTGWWFRYGSSSGPEDPSYPHGGQYRDDSLRVPLWFVCGLLMFAPALWLRGFRVKRRRERRRRDGLCPACGYDLRAHSPGQKCPECGQPIPADLLRKPIA